MLDGSEPPPPQISVAVGVVIGLLASFVQSLGLTIQRKSHLQNEALHISLRKPDHRRKLWIVGFIVFITSNLLGTIFQVGTLPMVVLGPLGAVSLLFNAGFARVILGDEFSIHLIVGTIMIAGGAVLIGIFGVVPEQTHSLEELVALYSRPAFIVWVSLLAFTVSLVLGSAHVTEWAFDRKCHSLLPPADSSVSPTTTRLARPWSRRASRDHIPFRPRLPSQSRSAPSAPEYGSFEAPSSLKISTTTNDDGGLRIDTIGGAETNNSNRHALEDGDKRDLLKGDEEGGGLSSAAIERTRLILGVAYGGASGTLSGLSLLFAKTGIELLILTVVGKNQFGNYRAWLIIAVLLMTALLQLFYLNRALRLVGPTLMCPLAFCFYNLSSIISGLIYFDEWKLLSALQFGLVSLGTVILLAGVWIVSIGTARVNVTENGLEYVEDEMTEEPESEDEGGDESEVEPMNWIPRGLSIGISASSPGFDLRPVHRRHTRTATLPDATTIPSLLDDDSAPLLIQRTASETDTEAAAGELLRRKRKARQRGFSISGNLYVGPRSPSLGTHETTTSAPNSPLPVTPSEENVAGAPDSSSPKSRWSLKGRFARN